MVIFVYFAVIALAFFLLIVLPQRRRTNAHRALLAALQVGDEVITIGGILGTIRELDDEKIRLEVADGVVLTVARNAIAQSVIDVPAPSSNGEAENGQADERPPAAPSGSSSSPSCWCSARSSSRWRAITNRSSASTSRAARRSSSHRSENSSPTLSTWPSTSSGAGSTPSARWNRRSPGRGATSSSTCPA